MKKPSLMDKDFRYVPASRTNVAETFKRIRRQLKEAEAAKKSGAKVTPIAPKKGTK